MALINNGHLWWCPVLAEPCHCKTAGYIAAAILAFFAATLEIWGGWESLSLALLADAWHVFSDMAVYAVAIWGNVMAVRHFAGIKEIKNKAAIWNANVLVAVALTTMALAVKRMIYPEEIFTEQMLFVAAIGLAVNLVMYLVLGAFRIEHEQGGREHSHDHLHDTAVWHTISDSLLSLVVVSVGFARWKFPEVESYDWLDPAASMAICIALICVASKMKRKIARRGRECRHEHHH